MFKYNRFRTILPWAMLAFSLAGGASESRTQSIQPVPEAVDKVPPPFPVVHEDSGRSARPSITGTWPEADAVKLTVEMAGKLYVLGRDAGLTSDGRGNWILILDRDLADSTYDVVVIATDRAGNSSADRGFGEVIVDTSSPAVPTVNRLLTRQRRPEITGTFPEHDAMTMAVYFDGKTVEMGDSGQLSSDGKGNWSLATVKELQPGRYDVKVVIADKAGKQRSDTTVDEIEILSNGQSSPVQPDSDGRLVLAAECQALLDEVLEEDQIRFSPGRALIPGKSAGLLGKLADAVKQCGNLEIEIGGHTDWQRSGSYNQALSERRANAVRDTLLARGARADNITAVGYGESQPIADNRNRKGRAANRRTEFRVLNKGN